MALESLQVKAFTVFESEKLSFCPGINVLIGENATGKSHVLKLMYAMTKPFEQLPSGRGRSSQRLSTQIADKLAGVFRPDDDRIGRLVRRTVGVDTTHVGLDGDAGRISLSFSSKGSALTLTRHQWNPTGKSLFIPSREALSMYEGFVAAYQARELSFDETYYDLCVALSAAALRGPRADKARELQEPLWKALGGPVRRIGERFYVRLGRANTEAHLVAEGLRKLASLVFLVGNGELGNNGTLFWDEPEANLNPKLITRVVDFLTVLAGHGVQVFLATHDYLLAHRLSLHAEATKKPAMRFFSFYRPSPAAPVSVEWANTLAGIEHNAILDEFARFYDDQRAAFDRSESVRGRRRGNSEEQDLRFTFPAGWNVCKWDGHPAQYHGIRKLERSCTVDFLALRGETGTLYLIEVKDCRGYRKENKERIAQYTLATEVAWKVRDTIAGLVGAHRANPDAWEPFVEALTRQDVKVVLWLEQDPRPPPETPQAKRRKSELGNLDLMLNVSLPGCTPGARSRAETHRYLASK